MPFLTTLLIAAAVALPGAALPSRRAIPAGWSSLGCYTDVSSRVLAGYSTTSSGLTQESCIATCAGKGYAYAGVEYGDECYCASQLASGASTSNGCTMSCAGSASETCGGSWAINVYHQTSTTTSTTSISTISTTTSSSSAAASMSGLPSGWSVAIACAQDTSARILTGYSTSSSSLTPSLCASICQQKGYAYAGVEYGDECYCGSGYNGGASATSGGCTMPCAGASGTTCGGSWAMQVYHYSAATTSVITTSSSTSATPTSTSTKSTSTSTLTSTTSTTAASTSTASSTALPSGWTTVAACAQDTSSRVLAAYSTTSPSLTPASCIAICAAKGYSYAGVEYADECYCGSSLNGGTPASLGSGSCSMACAGNAGIMCGGSWAMQLYGKSVTAASITTTSSTSAATTMTSSVATSTKFATTSTLAVTSSATTTTNKLATTSASSSVASSSTAATASASSSAIAPEATPAPPSSSNTKYVVAHHMVGNTYPYDQSNWLADIKLAYSKGIDAFVLNMGSDSWQPARVADAYAAAASSGTGFKLFFSFDMTSLPCGDANAAATLRGYLNAYAAHGNQFKYNGQPVVSTFSGENCNFGQGSVNAGWQSVVRTSVSATYLFIPSFFVDPATFSSYSVMDGSFNWNGGWPMSGSDITFDSDQTYINGNGGKLFMGAVSPWFFTHYGADTYNKNWIYRGDDWLFNTRWEQLIANRDKVNIVEIISWNDYGESHYIGPIEGAQPNSQAWVNGNDHQGWLNMVSYYATAFKTGTWPIVTADHIYMWSRPHPATATASADPVGRPTNYQWTSDYLWAVVFAQSAASVTLTSGGNTRTFAVQKGVTELKLANAAGGIRATMTRGGSQVVDVNPGSSFTYTTSPTAYNFNAFVASA